MNDKNSKVPGLTNEEIDRLMNPQLSVEERMTAWRPKPLNVQARKVLKQSNCNALHRHYLTALACLVTTLALWLLAPLLPASSQMLDMSARRLALYMASLSALVFGLLQAWGMSCAVTAIEEI